MDNFSSMRLFIIATQQKSLAAAARHVGISNASMSRQISALERHLNVRLFNRGTLTLTEAGHMLLERVRPLLDALDETVDSLSQLGGAARGLLRVSIRGLIASQKVIPALPRFLADHPELRIDLLMSTDENADLISQNIDVDVRFTVPDSGDLVARRLGTATQLVVLAAPPYLERCGRPTTPDELTSHAAVLYRTSVDTLWQFVDEQGQVHEVKPHGQLRVDDGAMNRSALLAGVGVGMMPLQEARKELAAGRLIRLLSDYRITLPQTGNDGVFAVYQRSSYQTGKLRSFLAFLDAVFRDEPPDALRKA